MAIKCIFMAQFLIAVKIQYKSLHLIDFIIPYFQMKNFLLSLIFILLYNQSNAQKSNYNQYWKKVENFELKDLPKSALAEVEKIYKLAKRESNEEQIIKTLIYRSKFTLELQEDAQLKIVNDLGKEVRSSGFPAKNILESILADLYWQYFQQNRYKFYNRTKTEKKVNPIDFRTWDLQTLFEEVHQHYKNSLKSPEELLKIPVRNYSEILILKEDSNIYRPSLYDFLAHRALNFYKTDERNIQNPTYKFTLKDPDLLKSNNTFLKAKLPSKDSLSQQLNAIYIYKDLTRFHLKDKDPYALVNLSLERLNYIKNHLISDEKEKIYLATLKELKEEFKLHPASAEIIWNIAKLYDQEANTYQPPEHTENQFKRQEALALCEEAIKKFPKAKGTEKCKVLIGNIKQQKLNITIEKDISLNTHSRALISYRNLNQLYFNIFKVSQSQKRQFEKFRSDSSRLAFIKDLKAEKQWISRLKNEKDYQQHSTEVLIPALSSGTYLILAREKEIPDENMLYAQQFFQVTDLSLVNINDPNKEIWQVINRNNGKPIKNAKVHVKNSQRYANRSEVIDHVFISDKDGLIQFEKKNYSNIYFTINYKNDRAVFGDYYIYNYNNQKDSTEKINAKAFLFTDRSIYRPGQTVYFKGILIQKNNDKSEVVSNEEVSITLYNVNKEEIKKVELTTNEFGSFSGEFILPSGGLTGKFLIEVDEGNANSKFYDKIEVFEMSETYISVEEYKRPKFETKFKPVTESFQLNDSIKVTGEAISFSGAKVSGAQVKYRVVRTGNIPSIYSYYYPQSSSEQEITHGETQTDASGNYTIEFKAIPDLKISKDLKPVFNYKVYADVTDINGETHSTETTVRVAYHLLEAELAISENIDKDQNDHKISITTRNLNGEFVPVTGQLKIYRLKSPDRILRKNLWNAPDYPGFTEEEFKKLFPHDAWKEERNPNKWKKGALVFEKEIHTGATKEVILKNTKNWKSGKYIATFTCTDRLQQKVESERKFNLYSHSKKDITKEQLIRVTANKPSYQAGEKAVIQLSSAAKDLFVTLSIEKDHKIIERKIIHLSNESKKIEIPVTQNDTGGFAVFYHTAFYNSFETGSLNILVPYPENELQITTRTFRDRIQPGSEQQWSFHIAGDKKDKVTAEVLASMYDASLDQFKMHQWDFTPVTHYIYRSYNKATASESFGITTLNVRNLRYQYSHIRNQEYDQLNWFGFSFNNSRWVKQRYLNTLVDKYTKPEISSKEDPNLTKGYISGIVSNESGPLPGVSV
ncbi:MAG: alpha-2-macroglobulin, partial [Flavobacteriia bacterium]